MFNSAKNKYDSDDENDFSGNNIIINNNNNICEIKIKTNSDNSFNENESCDTAISNAIISRDSNWSNNSNNQNIIIHTTQLNNNFNVSMKNKNIKSFLEGNKIIPDVKKIYKNEEPKDFLTSHIKQALRQMEKEYFYNNINGNNNSHRNKYNYCEYFFSSGINRIWENNDENL